MLFAFFLLPPPPLLKCPSRSLLSLTMLIWGITRIPHDKPSGNLVEVVILGSNGSLLASVSEMAPSQAGTVAKRRDGLVFCLLGPFYSLTLDQPNLFHEVLCSFLYDPPASRPSLPA